MIEVGKRPTLFCQSTSPVSAAKALTVALVSPTKSAACGLPSRVTLPSVSEVRSEGCGRYQRMQPVSRSRASRPLPEATTKIVLSVIAGCERASALLGSPNAHLRRSFETLLASRDVVEASWEAVALASIPKRETSGRPSGTSRSLHIVSGFGCQGSASDETCAVSAKSSSGGRPAACVFILPFIRAKKT